MLFNSLDFGCFFLIVFVVYWALARYGSRHLNILIVVSSYLFYGWWDWRFLSLIIWSTLCDYYIGLQLYTESSEVKRKRLLWLSVAINIGLLSVFKYYNFFIDNFNGLISVFGFKVGLNSLSLILPIGISFYTFQTLSYTIDIYNKKLEPTKDLISFAAFVAFFPQLIAGPIERAKNLLPQFRCERTFSYSETIDGLKQILWGLFKKMVIADNCAQYVDLIFDHTATYSGSTLLLGALFFTFQIYCDFSGYSDIAIGCSRMLGIKLQNNFLYPYFSKSMSEFWHRWHISLSTWFRDYVYIPLGGSRVSKTLIIRNVFLVFLLSGFWHGANWTFIIWGLLHAVLYLSSIFGRKSKGKTSLHISALSPFVDIIKMSIVFMVIVLSWILFRAESISQAIDYYKGIFSTSLFSKPEFTNESGAFIVIILVCFLMIIEWAGRNSDYAIQSILINNSWIVRWGFYSFIIFLIGMYAQTSGTPFIYFQF